MDKFLKLPGYVIKISTISGLSEIEKVVKAVDNPNKKVDGQKTIDETFYHLSLFFDGSRIEWFFEQEEQAKVVEIAVRQYMDIYK
jgi:hypothetical protein